MFEPLKADPATKKAAIDWLLSHGEVNETSEWTGSALATLKHVGVDYDASYIPQHTRVEVASDEIGRVGDRISAISAIIVAQGPTGRPDRFEFVLPEASFAHMVMGMAIGATPLNRGSFEPDWKDRASTSTYHRLVAEAKDAQEREEARLFALAAHEGYPSLVGRTVRSVDGDPQDPSEYGIVRSISDQGRTYGVVWHGDVTTHAASYHEIEFVAEGDVPLTFTRQ